MSPQPLRMPSQLNDNNNLRMPAQPSLRSNSGPDQDDTASQAANSADQESKMSTSDLIIAKLLQSHQAKKNISKGNFDRPLDRMKANIFNSGMNSVNNIDFKNHEDFARFVFDNNAVQEALQNQFGRYLPSTPLQEDQGSTLVNNIPSFLSKLGSQDQLNLSGAAAGATAAPNSQNTISFPSTNPRPITSIENLPPPPPPKPH